MITIIDYGIGNLRSIEKAFEAVGADVIRTDREADVRRGDKVVLPGVGAFGACAAEIRRRGLEDPVRRAIDEGKPFLGVCVGMQLLFEVGEEMGRHEGLGVLSGRVLRLDAAAERAPALAPSGGEDGARPDRGLGAAAEAGSGRETMHGGASGGESGGWTADLKIPHMGWNTIEKQRENPLLEGLPAEAYFYFVHSFAAVPADFEDVLATCRYGLDFPAVVHRNNVYGVQFHPEKSQQNGLRILRNFAELA